MKTGIHSSSLACLLAIALGLSVQVAAQPPNFVLILTDDHGWTNPCDPHG